MRKQVGIGLVFPISKPVFLVKLVTHKNNSYTGYDFVGTANNKNDAINSAMSACNDFRWIDTKFTETSMISNKASSIIL